MIGVLRGKTEKGFEVVMYVSRKIEESEYWVEEHSESELRKLVSGGKLIVGWSEDENNRCYYDNLGEFVQTVVTQYSLFNDAELALYPIIRGMQSKGVSRPEDVTQTIFNIASISTARDAELTELVVPDGALIVGNATVAEYPNLRYFALSKGVDILAAYNFVLFMPKVVKMDLTSDVQELPNFFATKCRFLTTVILPDSLQSIGKECFSGCDSLRDVVLPYGLRQIGSRAFYRTAIEYLELPASVRLVGAKAFHMCKSLKEVVLHTMSVAESRIAGEYLGDNEAVFGARSSVTKVTVKGGGKSFFPSAFKFFNSLTDVDLCEGIEVLPEKAFLSCTALQSIKLPSTVRVISSWAFHACTALSHIELSEILQKIESFAFQKTGLVSMTIPSDCKHIGECAFANCQELRSVCIQAEGISLEDAAFRGCVTLSEVTLPSGMQALGSYCFCDCTQLAEIAIPEGITELPERCFYNTGLQSITLPGTLRTIGSECFKKCEQLKELTIPDGVETIPDCLPDGLSVLRLPDSVKFVSALFLRDTSSAVNRWENLTIEVSERSKCFGDIQRFYELHAFQCLKIVG